MPRERFGDVLREVRTQKGVTIYRISADHGIPFGSISRLENNRRGASREMVDKLGDALRASPEERARLYLSAGVLPVSPSVRRACGDLLLREG